jgi:hypothetical protein
VHVVALIHTPPTQPSNGHSSNIGTLTDSVLHVLSISQAIYVQVLVPLGGMVVGGVVVGGVVVGGVVVGGVVVGGVVVGGVKQFPLAESHIEGDIQPLQLPLTQISQPEHCDTQIPLSHVIHEGHEGIHIFGGQ